MTLATGMKDSDSPSAFQGAFRSAFLVNGDLGFRISGQYLDAEERHYIDPTEEAGRIDALSDPLRCRADKRVRGLTAPEATQACSHIGARDFDLLLRSAPSPEGGRSRRA